MPTTAMTHHKAGTRHLIDETLHTGVVPYSEHVRTVNVRLGTRSYAIHVGKGLIRQLGEECRSLGLGQKCAIITDRNVARHYLKPVVTNMQNAGFSPAVIILPPGENTKSLKTAQTCYNRMAKSRIERDSFVLALGGGVVGDLSGFVAATYMRGIPFVQVPTTLLAQVDSSVGGKVGVNLAIGKNLVGAFYQPRLVIVDVDTLRTLPEREFRAGMAEVIKYGIIYDAALFERIDRNLEKILKHDPDLVSDIVSTCCKIKAEVVAKDERECGLRAILNFGHTIGHALEALYGYRKYLHGEAIAIGQVVAARISARLMNLPQADVARIRNILLRCGLPVQTSLSPRQFNRVWQIALLDKKVREGEVRFVLIPRIGRAIWGRQVPVEIVRECFVAE